MNNLEPSKSSDHDHTTVCPKCGNIQTIKKTGTIKAIVYVLLLPIIWLGMLLLSTVFQIDVSSWLGRKTECAKCGETFETMERKSNQAL
jgi:ribosomal protein S27AE